MSKVYVLLAEGFEESEAVVPIDLLRRARVEVVTVSITEDPLVLSSHGIPVTADTVLSKVEDTADALFLPGGLKGTNNLKASEAVAEFIRRHLEADRYMTAICAAPTVYGEMGLLQGKKATCYPGHEDKLLGAEWTGAVQTVTVDGKFITSRGMGTSLDFGLKLIEVLVSREKAQEIANQVLHPRAL